MKEKVFLGERDFIFIFGTISLGKGLGFPPPLKNNVYKPSIVQEEASL